MILQALAFYLFALVAVASGVMVVAARNRLLYPLAPQTRTLNISKAELNRELIRLLIGYLKS